MTKNTIVTQEELFPENTPDALKQCRQWMGTRFEPREDGKLNKPPYRAQTELPIIKADKTDPRSWTSFAEASEALRHKSVDAIGFAFSAEDSFCCIDLDNCRNAATGEISPWAREIVEALPSYWEVSVSETGLHAIFEGTKPGGRCRRGAIEIYDHDRFLVVTGKHLQGTPTEIRRCQASVDALYRKVFGEEDITQDDAPVQAPGSALGDHELHERIMRSKHAEKFARLWDGDISGYDSHSNADLALCGMLAFWSGGDAAQIERLFSRSGLCRPKWIRRADYRERTIEKALEGKTEFYAPPAKLNRRRVKPRGRVYARREGVTNRVR
jgi:putative DNA primase/helicase